MFFLGYFSDAYLFRRSGGGSNIRETIRRALERDVWIGEHAVSRSVACAVFADYANSVDLVGDQDGIVNCNVSLQFNYGPLIL